MRKRLLPCSVATLLAAASASGQCAPRWQPGAAFASHINGNVAALLPWDPDGAGPQPEVLVVAGSFTMIGTTAIHRLAVWNGSSWSPLGTPLPFTPACLAVFQGDLIAAGHLNGPPGAISAIARWDGSAWQPMGAGFNDSVLALQVVGNQLFAGGFFSASGALPLSRVAVWDGGKWANVGGGVTAGQAFPSVNALADYNGHLIAGGFFSAAGGIQASHIARWDGQQWHALGAGVAPSVMALGTFAGDLIAAGSFESAGGAPASRIARWDGLAWNPIGGGMNQAVAALTIAGDRLVAAGFFNTAGGNAARRVATWDGVAWSGLGSGLLSSFGPEAANVKALASFQDEIIAGGFFTSAGGEPSMNAARWSCDCYANCDGSSTAPTLNINDFVCFLGLFAAGDLAANCDGSFTTPMLTVNDFTCFLNKFAAGCE